MNTNDFIDVTMLEDCAERIHHSDFYYLARCYMAVSDCPCGARGRWGRQIWSVGVFETNLASLPELAQRERKVA